MSTSGWIGIAFLIVVALSAACRAPQAPPKEALTGWLYRTQGLVGVFPPREDVRVGDVHLYLNDPDGGNHAELYRAPRWSYLPSSELLQSGYRLRPEYPPTPADLLKSGVAPVERTWPESTADPGFLEPGEEPPSWGLHQVLEESYDDWESVRVRIEAAETASLALEDALRAYLERRGSSFYLPASL
jgi:hypothetical protein